MSDDADSEDQAAAASHNERKLGRCELCERPGKALTFHHLIPRHCHRKRRFRKRFSISEMRDRGLWICRACHSGIHDLIPDEKTLGWDYNTVESLLAHEGVRKHVDWVRKQK